MFKKLPATFQILLKDECQRTDFPLVHGNCRTNNWLTRYLKVGDLEDENMADGMTTEQKTSFKTAPWLIKITAPGFNDVGGVGTMEVVYAGDLTPVPNMTRLTWQARPSIGNGGVTIESADPTKLPIDGMEYVDSASLATAGVTKLPTPPTKRWYLLTRESMHITSFLGTNANCYDFKVAATGLLPNLTKVPGTDPMCGASWVFPQ